MGKRTDGIRSIEDIRQRCHVDDDTGCWTWRGCVTSGGVPNMWIAELRTTQSIGSALRFLQSGLEPGTSIGRLMLAKCGNRLCCNPQHRKDVRSGVQTRGLKRTAANKARMAEATKFHARARSKITVDDVQRIRNGTERGVDLAAELGVSPQTISTIRQGRSWRDAPASSVFGWRP